MSKYKVKVHVELVECEDTANHDLTKNDDGSFSMIISGKDATSIDICEKSVLQTAYPMIREAVSKHLTEISKKKPKKSQGREK